MITPILVLIFLGIAVYFDVRYRGMPRFLPILFCGIGTMANLLMGSKIDETLALLLLVCGMIYLASFTRIYARHDGIMLCAITLTTPFMGWMIPSILCGALGVIGGFAALLILCRIRNAEHPYVEVKNISSKKTKLAKIISHVNGGQRFVVAAIKTNRDNAEKFNFNISRSEMGKTDAKYVIPVIPLMPFFAGCYVLLLILFFS